MSPSAARRLVVTILCTLSAWAVVGMSTGLLTGRPVGAGDNGDGVRLFCGVGLVPDTPGAQANWMGGVVLDFVAGQQACPDPVPSSARLLLSLAIGGEGGPWSLTSLGWLYLALVGGVTLLAAWAATAGALVRAAVVLVPLAPLASGDFSRFFLSTYGEPAGLLGAFALCSGAAAVAVTRPEHRTARCTALFLVGAGGLLAATSKTAYAPLLAVAMSVCAITAVATAGRWSQRRWSRHIVGPLLAAGLAVAAVAPLSASQEWQARNYAWVNTHNLVYTLLLEEVGPEAAAEVGLPAEAAARAGHSYYPDGPQGVPGAEVIADDPEGVRTAAWAALLRHPGALAESWGIAMQATLGRDLDYLPEQPWTPDTPRSTEVSPVGAQAATSEVMHDWLDDMAAPWWPSLLALLGLAAGAASLRIGPPLVRGLARLAGLSAGSALGLALVAVLGDGYFEIAKHVWLAAYLLDVTLWALAAGALALVGGAVVRRSRGRTPAWGPSTR